MRERRNMSRKAGGVWGCKPHNIRRGKEYELGKSLYSRALRSILIQLQSMYYSELI